MKFLLPICCATIIACNNDSRTATSTDSTSTATAAAADTSALVAPSCYALETSNNIVSLKLNAIQPLVSGQLTYDIMGKDKNEGTITGTMHGDTLLAHYNFMSEGIRSVRQVAFLRKGDTFVEGYGDAVQKGDTMVFSNLDSLDFNGTMILKEVPCNLP